MNKFWQKAALTVAATLAIGAAHAAAQVGKESPAFSLLTDAGQIKLSDLKGKVVYVDFWASWCGPCRASFKWLNEAQEKYAAKGLVIVGINVDKDKAAAAEFLKENPAKFRIAYDPEGKAAESYQLKGMPSTFFIDRKDVVRLTHVGYRIKDKEALTAELEKLLAE